MNLKQRQKLRAEQIRRGKIATRRYHDADSQDDLRIDHGDIMGDPYSRSMFEAQQERAA